MSPLLKQKKNFHTSSSSGFTVVELMVTLTIVVMVTGIIMVQYSSFNSSVLLTSQAYETAFDIREAQSMAISVRGQSSRFREEYGLYFDITSSNPNRYILFQDNDANGNHSPARYHAGEQIGSPLLLDPRFVLKNLCATVGSTRTCYANDPSTTGEVINSGFHDVAISFKRPDFDAEFYSAGRSGIESIEIKFGTPGGTIERSVTVYRTGQISID